MSGEVRWTPEQEQAITARGTDLLVAAVGEPTARAARAAGWVVDLVPPDASAAALVEFALAPVESGVAVVEALFDAGEFRPAGTSFEFGLVLDLHGGLFGDEFGLATRGLGPSIGVLDDGSGIRASLGETGRGAGFADEIPCGRADAESDGQPQDQK